MPRFFVNQNQIEEEYVTIYGEDAHHISRSLRMAVGEHIIVSDSEKYEYDCVLELFADGYVKAKIVNRFISESELPIKIHLFQAIPKGDKLDFIIQKSVECGVYEITPFESEYCVVKVKRDAEERKTERRNKIALEAAKQCGRGVLPAVEPTVSFERMLEMVKDADLPLFCYEGDDTLPIGRVLSHASVPAGGEIALVVGSEGGFSLGEAQRARALGCHMIGLGPRILRTETAPLFALACISYHLELSSQ